MESALEEIEFLARSSNRVTVLQLLADDDWTRKELSDKTDVSQATLGRILGDFQDRSWADRDGSTYRATATGRLVATGFQDLQTIIQTEHRLRELVPFLPTEDLTFDLRHLADAKLVTPSRIRPDAPLQRLLDLLKEAKEVKAVSHAFNEQALQIVDDRVRADDLRFEAVFSKAAIDGLRSDAELRDQFRCLLAQEQATVKVVETVSVAVMLLDETVCFLIRDGDGILRASIDTDAAAVRTWAIETIADFQQEARTLTPADIVEHN